MSQFTQALCFGGGMLLLGVALTLGFLIRLTSRPAEGEIGSSGGAGCLGFLVVLFPLTLAALLLARAVLI